MKKISLLVSLFLFLFLSPQIKASSLIKIGCSLSLSGKYQVMGEMQKKAFELWKNEINQKGGILGKQVSLIIHDDKSSKKKAVELYKKLIRKEKVDLLFAPYSSAITEMVLPITEKYKYPLLASGAAANHLWQKNYKYFFGIYAPASRYTLGFLELLVKNKIKNIAIVYANDSFSKEIAIGTQKWANRFGLNIVLFQEFAKERTNLDSIALKIKQENAEAIIVGSHFEESKNIRRSLKNINWYPKAYYASVGPALDQYFSELKNDANLSFSSSQWEPSSNIPYPGSRNFTRNFIKKYNLKPSYHAGIAYAAAQILTEAIVKAKSLNRNKIRNTLSTLDTFSTIGKYGVDSSGLQIRHTTITLQWQKGKKEIVAPLEIQSKKAIFYEN